jgi:2-iminoacetate synthase
MSFASIFNPLEHVELAAFAQTATTTDVEGALARSGSSRMRLEDFAALVSPVAGGPEYLEEMARQSQALTLKHFGRVIRLFAPLYLSNECINVCKYCGFSRDNPILRVTLSLDQVIAEGRYLHAEGFRHLLLVAGEHPHFVSGNYLRDCVDRLRKDWPSISLEVGPMGTDGYRPIVEAGAEGLVIYQETYDRSVYDAMHVSGPKKEFDWRLETPERAVAAGFKRIGIGALLGLAPWRQEAIAVAAHASYLLKKCWTAQLTISVPRLRPAAGEFHPLVNVKDSEFVQIVCALRLMFPEIGLVLSTRESEKLRDGLVRLGITMMSAGSHTEPGGYTGQGRENLHLTTGGRRIKPDSTMIESEGEHATVQFNIADGRSAQEISAVIAGMGYESVWKDWESTLNER